MRRVVLVTGPPCAGKTTYVRQHAHPGDQILDQDHLGARRMSQAIAALPAMTDGTAWVIRCAPGPKARRHLAQQIGATDLIHLVEPEHVLVRRAAHRPHPRRHIAAVAQWFVREREDRPPRVSRPRSTLGTTERGYGWPHQQARARAIAAMRDGDPCPRCGGPMYRSQAKLLDLDHTDDRAGYQGLAHRSCNRRAGQARAAQARRAHHAGSTTPATQPQPQPRSRNW